MKKKEWREWWQLKSSFDNLEYPKPELLQNGKYKYTIQLHPTALVNKKTAIFFYIGCLLLFGTFISLTQILEGPDVLYHVVSGIITFIIGICFLIPFYKTKQNLKKLPIRQKTVVKDSKASIGRAATYYDVLFEGITNWFPVTRVAYHVLKQGDSVYLTYFPQAKLAQTIELESETERRPLTRWEAGQKEMGKTMSLMFLIVVGLLIYMAFLLISFAFSYFS